jgi:hypothetical protein
MLGRVSLLPTLDIILVKVHAADDIAGGIGLRP